MTEDTCDAIVQAFCQDCHERRLRAREIVRGGVPLSSVQLDRLHQEFDTLYGGARAVHVPELEHFFHGLARYARYLRNFQCCGKEVEARAWQLLLTGIEKGLRCGDDPVSCIRQGGGERSLLLQEINDIIDNKGAA